MRSYGITNVAPWASAPPVGPAGDTYFNTTEHIFYISNGTAWISQPGPQGPQGEASRWFAGSGPPDMPLGPYDFYLDVDTGDVYTAASLAQSRGVIGAGSALIPVQSIIPHSNGNGSTT